MPLPNEGGVTPTPATVDITPIVDELKEIKENSLYVSKDSYIKDVAAKLFANVSFNIDTRPHEIIAKECIQKASILANYLYKNEN